MKPVRIVLASILFAMVLTIPGYGQAASNSLGVNPRRNYTIEPGSKVNDSLYISNLSQTDDLNITIDVIDFGAKNETGSPALQLDSKQTSRWSLKPYLTVPKSATVAAGKSTTIPLSIAIPKGVGGGSFYGAIKYSTAGDNGNNVSLASSSATLVFVRVAGPATDALLLKTFGAFTPDATAESGAFGKFYIGSSPRYLSYRLQNTGNVAEQPNGSIELKNTVGKKTTSIDKANPNSNIILIGQTRRIDVCINPQTVTESSAASAAGADKSVCEDAKLWPGRYTAKLALLYGDDGAAVSGASSHELNAVTSFWYLPTWSIIGIIILLLVLALIIFLIVRVARGKGRYHGRK